MRTKVVESPTGRWLVQRGLEGHLPPMGFCAACGRGFLSRPPEGPPHARCGCEGAGAPPQRTPRRFCSGCGNGRRCRCPRRTTPARESCGVR